MSSFSFSIAYGAVTNWIIYLAFVSDCDYSQAISEPGNNC